MEDTFPKAPPQKPIEEPADKIIVRPLRTYEDDVKEAVKSQDVSSTRILLAEQRRRDQEQIVREETSPTSSKNLFFIILSVLLIVAGISAFFIPGLFKKSEPEVLPISFGSKVGADRTEFVDSMNKNNVEIKRDLLAEFRKGTDLPKNAVKEIVLTKTTEKLSEEGVLEKFRESVSTSEFLGFLNLNFPAETIRSLGDKFAMGVYIGEKEYPFVVFEVKDYSLAYGKMLEKENEVAKTFVWLFETTENVLPPTTQTTPAATSTIPVSVSTSTATSSFATSSIATSSKPERGIAEGLSEEAKKELLKNYVFRDAIIRNKDVRILYTDDGKVLLFYSFVNNKKHLIVTNDGNALDEIIRRVNAASFVR